MEVILSKDARKQLEKLPKANQVKVRKKLMAIADNPTIGKKLSGELKDIRSVRAWPYRILYEINKKENRIEIHKIAHSQGVYN